MAQVFKCLFYLAIREILSGSATNVVKSYAPFNVNFKPSQYGVED